MTKKKQLIYYIAVISAFITTQAPFWVARKATAATATTAVKKPAAKKKKAVSTKAKVVAVKKAAAKVRKPYKVTSCTNCTFDESRKVLVCEQGQGMKLELPVKVRKLTGDHMKYLARLPKRKNALCGLAIPKKGEKLGDGKAGAAQQCALVIDDARLDQASLVMPEKLKSLKPKTK